MKVRIVILAIVPGASLIVSYLLVIDYIGVLVMGMAVTVHVVVLVVVAVGKVTVLLKKKLVGSPFLVKMYGVISTVYASPGCTPYSVTLVLLTAIGNWSELTLCVIR